MSKDNGNCRKCRGLCCRYFGLPIDTPETPGDFNDIHWYLLHKGTEVYVSDGDWYLNVKNACRQLGADYSCGIYETRPKICRQYATEQCDITSAEYDHEHHFYSPEQLKEYARGFLRDKRRLAQLRGRRRRSRQS